MPFWTQTEQGTWLYTDDNNNIVGEYAAPNDALVGGAVAGPTGFAAAPPRYDPNGQPIFSNWSQDEIDNHMRVIAAQQAQDQYYQSTPEYQQHKKQNEWAAAIPNRIRDWNNAYDTTRTTLQKNARTALTEANALDLWPTIAQQIDETLQPYRGYTEQGVGVFDTSPLTNLANRDIVGDALLGVRTQRRDTAYMDALKKGAGQLASRGIGDMGTAYAQEMHNLWARTAPTANDYSNVFDPSAVLDKLTNQKRTDTRFANQQAFNQTLGGYDVNTLLGDTADDPYIADIVGSSYSDAKAALDRARARGSLTDTGYSASIGEVARQRSAADTTAQTLGGAVLQRGRTQLGDILNEAKTGATSWDLGMAAYDPNRYATRFNQRREQFTSGLGGEIASALAGQNFFDVGAALNKGGFAQGAQNTRALGSGFMTPAQAALLNQRDETDEAKRGLGGTGTF